MLTVISWNVYTRHPVDQVRHELRAIIAAHDPDAIVLYESKHLYGHLRGLGYKVSQLSDKNPLAVHRKGDVTGSSNVAILTKASIKRKGVWTLYMSRFWKGPHLGAPQDPRVYRWTKLKVDGTTWKLGGFHIPFGNAPRSETITAIKGWFNVTRKGRPVIAVGDFNMGRNDVEHQIAIPVGARMGGEGIDDTVFRNCRLVDQQDIGHHGSDHPAMKYRFAA